MGLKAPVLSLKAKAECNTVGPQGLIARFSEASAR
jgi:hypothetical protein